MRIGIPKEIKPHEGRVALIPDACAKLRACGHELLIERDAGVSSGYGNAAYEAAGARLLDTPQEVYGLAELLVKVKEPIGPELLLLRPEQLLFSFLHLASNADLARRLMEIGLTAIAFETVAVGGRYPILAPMSEIAGLIAVQIGTHLLHGPQGGPGILLGGVAGTERGRVCVLGAGVAGSAAVRLAAAQGAEVTVLDLDPDRLTQVRGFGANVAALYAYPDRVQHCVEEADLLIGAVMLPGRRTPRLVSRAQVRRMRPGSVIVDVSVDQGGCLETTRPTTYQDPVYRDEDVLHFAVTNMPGAVPRTASQALSVRLVDFCARLAEPGWTADESLRMAVNVQAGEVVHPGVRDALSRYNHNFTK